jgi:alpha-maltose-1-phosphate synthase
MRIAYAHFGDQSGVTPHVTAALEALGHEVVPLPAIGPLEPWDAATGRPRVTGPVVLHLAAALLRYGRRAMSYRWNTGVAFDLHSWSVGEQLASAGPIDAVLQNGALFSPGLPPALPYVLYVDYTRALAERSPPVRAAGLAPQPGWGEAWRRRERALYGGAAAIAAFSARAARSVVEDYGVAAAKVQVVGPGANVPLAQRARSDDGETVLFVGREFARKGGPILLDAFSRLRRVRPAARLLVAGPTRAIPTPPGVTHLGAVPVEALPALFARATVFALPTLQEPFGIAYLDAMSCGLPCVATRTEAVPEIVEDGETGLLVPPGDAAALAVALERLLADRDLARRMGERGRARVEERFTWRRAADALAVALAAASASRERAVRFSAPPARQRRRWTAAGFLREAVLRSSR